MQDLLSQAVMITAFGGATVIGLLVLLSGLFAARRTSSVIACAAVSASLFAVQLGWIHVWRSFGVGFGGEGGHSALILEWGSVAAVALVVGFLVVKLPGALGKTVETAHWLRDGARISALIVLAYVLYLVGGILLRWAYPPGSAVPPPALASWMITLGGVVLAWGLWRHHMWAWTGALVCCVYAIARILWFAYPSLLADLSFLVMATPVGIRLILLALLLGVLLFSNARKLCIPPTPLKKA